MDAGRNTRRCLCETSDETPRNDHIVRFNQEVIYAIDPDTGRPYNVVHVDNTASGTETGDFESPFNTLAEAEAASIEDDIIFVNDGDGSTTGYDTGFVIERWPVAFGRRSLTSDSNWQCRSFRQLV